MAQPYNPTPAASPPTTPANTETSEVPYDQPIKSKRRQRIVQGLQRISSFPLLAKTGRSRAGEYRSGGLGSGSLSCLSLGSPPSYSCLYAPNSYSSQLSTTAPTPPTTPGSIGGGNGYFGPRPSVRRERDTSGKGVLCPQSIPVPTLSHASDDLLARGKQKATRPFPQRANFNFWGDLPHELRVGILRFLSPKQLVRLSVVSKSWHEMCFDGQLWTELNTHNYYQQITSDALIQIMLKAGPFVKNLNLRGCVQLRHQWLVLGSRLTDRECRNLEKLSIEGCMMNRSNVHFFLLRNPRLVYLNMSAVQNINNATMKIIASHCPQLKFLNIDWCSQVDTRGLKRVIQSCPNLSDLRASDIRGLDDDGFMLELFQRNTLERLILQQCDSLTDDALAVLTNGVEPEIDPLTDRAIVPPRRLRHLDISKCHSLGDKGVKSMAYNVPHLEGLRLCQNHALTDDALINILSNTPCLTHLEVEDIESLTNTVLTTLAAGPGAPSLEYLSISYCEHLGDVGVLPILKSCPKVKYLCLDNTRVSDLVLIEAADQVRKRGSTTNPNHRPKKGLDLIAFDCQNITWAGVREIMSQNTRILQSRPSAQQQQQQSSARQQAGGSLLTTGPTVRVQPLLVYPQNLIRLKVFYGWQQTVDEHYKRCMTARWAAAARLEGKWAEWMLASEAGNAASGGGAGGGTGGWAGRRRRRRAREAEIRVRDDEENGGVGVGFAGAGAGAGAGDGFVTSGLGLEHGSAATATTAADGMVMALGMGVLGAGAGAGTGSGRRRARSGGSCIVM